MARIAFIACSKAKGPSATRAGTLYISPLFRKSLLYALANYDKAYILSAKHGLLDLDTRIEPYDMTLKNFSRIEKNAWNTKVTRQILEVVRNRDTLSFLAGSEYYDGLLSGIEGKSRRIEFPLKKARLGPRLALLRRFNNEEALHKVVDAFYRTIKDLYDAHQGGIKLSDCSGRMPWPSRGIYFFYDLPSPNDSTFAKYGVPRITRIGTHAVSAGSQTTLWNRLSSHRGSIAGLGNHRSSIFRLHVGQALCQKPGVQLPPSWGKGQNPSAEVKTSEAELERKVTETIGEMKLLWLEVPDNAGPASDRSYLERNSIGVLSRHNILTDCIPADWLGRYSPRIEIAMSGLWNLNHLFVNPDPSFISVLQKYVKITVKHAPNPKSSLAPQGWHSRL